MKKSGKDLVPVFKMKSEIRAEWEEHPADGVGKLLKNLLVTPAECPRCFAFVNLIELQPGNTIGMHEHRGSGEIYWFLQGEGEYFDKGRMYKTCPGDVAVCYDGESHGVANHGNQVLKFLAVKYLNSRCGKNP